MNRILLLSVFSFFSLAIFAQAKPNKKLAALQTQKAKAPVSVQAVDATHSNVPAIVETATNAIAVAPETVADGLAVKEAEHNFGKIPQGTPVTYNFTVNNSSNAPFKLENVQASCGCTTPEWNKEEVIQPGNTGIIKVGYNAAAAGPFNKTITVTYNGSQTKQLFIKGEVWTIPAESAPVNTPMKSLN